MMRRRWGSALAVTFVLALAGCSNPPIDPALTSAVSQAISSGTSAQLGLQLSEKDRILSGTLTALLGDMETNLADNERQLEMHQAADAQDAEYRKKALSGVRDSLEAVHRAQAGQHDAALDELTASLEDLNALEAEG